MADLIAARVADCLDPVKYMTDEATNVNPDCETQEAGVLWGLYYAIYYGGAEQFKTMPSSVALAYGRVQELVRNG